MASRLIPCPSCDRYVRPAETACPFCEAPLAQNASPASAAAPQRKAGAGLTRAAILFAGATAAAACGTPASADSGTDSAVTTDTVTTDTVTTDSPSTTDVQPGTDGATVDSSSGTDAADDQPVVLYGPAPVDSGTNPG